MNKKMHTITTMESHSVAVTTPLSSLEVGDWVYIKEPERAENTIGVIVDLLPDNKNFIRVCLISPQCGRCVCYQKEMSVILIHEVKVAIQNNNNTPLAK